MTATAITTITVVEDKIVMGNTQMTMVVEIPKSQSPESLTSMNTRQWIMNEARSRGFPAHGLGSIPQPYPVDANGNTDDELIMGKRDFVAWRADYQIYAGVR